MKMSRNFFVAKPLRKVEVGSTSCHSDCNKNTARHVHCRVYHNTQRFVELVSHPGCRNGSTELRDKLQDKLPRVGRLNFQF